MPRGDGTGPLGFGPLTGRGAGFCTGFRIPGYKNPITGQRLWLNQGRRCTRWLCLTGLVSGCAFLACKFVNRNRMGK